MARGGLSMHMTLLQGRGCGDAIPSLLQERSVLRRGLGIHGRQVVVQAGQLGLMIHKRICFTGRSGIRALTGMVTYG